MKFAATPSLVRALRITGRCDRRGLSIAGTNDNRRTPCSINLPIRPYGGILGLWIDAAGFVTTNPLIDEEMC
jgi:hypothetical protein